MCLSVNNSCSLSSLIVSTPQFLSYLDGEDTLLLIKVSREFARLIDAYKEKGVVPSYLIHDTLKPLENIPKGNLDKKLIAYVTQRWGNKFFKKEVEPFRNVFQKRGYFIVNGDDSTLYFNTSPEILENPSQILENASQVHASRAGNELVFRHRKEDLTFGNREKIEERLPEGVIEIPADEDADEMLKHASEMSALQKANNKNRAEFDRLTFVLDKKGVVVGSSIEGEVNLRRWEELNSRGPWHKIEKLGHGELLLENEKELLLVSTEGEVLAKFIKEERKQWISDAACIGGGFLVLGIKKSVRFYRLEEHRTLQGTNDFFDSWQLNAKGRIQSIFFLKNGVLILRMSTGRILRITPFLVEQDNQ